MKKFVGLFAVIVALAFVGCTTVAPGYVGLKVNKMGTSRGVDAFPIVTGLVGYNPISTSIIEYPTFVQTAVWTHNVNEGSPINEEITFNSKEGTVISGDISLSYQLDPAKAAHFYVKYKCDDLANFTHGFLRNVARDAFTEIGATYGVEELYGEKKSELMTKVRDEVNTKINAEGVKIEQFGLIGAFRMPQAITDALNAKMAATQNAMRVQNEVAQAQAEAQKAVAEAEGQSKSKVAIAEGEAKANMILIKSLTPELLNWRRLQLEQQAIEKWNGTVPSVMSGSNGMLFNIPTGTNK